MAVNTEIMIFWDMTPCGVTYSAFWKNYYFHLLGRKQGQ
jgi:hypothetical protein